MKGLRWEGDKKTEFYLVDRRTMKHVATFESTVAFFCFHTVNAFETFDGDICIDLLQYENSDQMFNLKIENFRDAKNMSPLGFGTLV